MSAKALEQLRKKKADSHEKRMKHMRREADDLNAQAAEFRAMAAKCCAETGVAISVPVTQKGRKRSTLVSMGSMGSEKSITKTPPRGNHKKMAASSLCVKKEALSVAKASIEAATKDLPPTLTFTTRVKSPSVKAKLVKAPHIKYITPPELIRNPYLLSVPSITSGEFLSAVSFSDASTLTKSSVTTVSMKMPPSTRKNPVSSQGYLADSMKDDCPMQLASSNFTGVVMINECDTKLGRYNKLDIHKHTQHGHRYTVEAFTKFGVIQGKITGVTVPELSALTLHMMTGRVHTTLEL